MAPPPAEPRLWRYPPDVGRADRRLRPALQIIVGTCAVRQTRPTPEDPAAYSEALSVADMAALLHHRGSSARSSPVSRSAATCRSPFTWPTRRWLAL
jgi:hypothetical protein